MGKYTNFARGAAYNATARSMVEKWGRLIKGGIVQPPAFWDALQAVPPPQRPFDRKGKVPEIVFPEDQLYKVYMKRNPEWRNETLKGHMTARLKGERTRGDLFVMQWQKYIEQGIAKEDAYAKVEEEFKSVEGHKQAQIEEEVELLRTGKHPVYNAWLEEEEKYVEEAYDYHKTQWEAANRAKKIEADMRAQAALDAVAAKIRDDEEAKVAKVAAKAEKDKKKKKAEAAADAA